MYIVEPDAKTQLDNMLQQNTIQLIDQSRESLKDQSEEESKDEPKDKETGEEVKSPEDAKDGKTEGTDKKKPGRRCVLLRKEFPVEHDYAVIGATEFSLIIAFKKFSPE